MKSKNRKLVGACMLLSLAGIAGIAAAQTTPKTADKAVAAETQDAIIFRNGTVLYGKVVSETPTSIHFKGLIAGIMADTDYPRSEILEIKKNLPVASTGEKMVEGRIEKPSAKVEEADEGGTKNRYYWIDLKGNFGEEITETPLHKMFNDARDNKADTVIVCLDAQFINPRSEQEREGFEGDFEGLRRGTTMAQALVNDIPVEWNGKPPRLVFWVKKALGGACILPMVSKEVYFAPEGKMGGIGNLSYMMRGNVRVVEKQISLRLQRLVGWANVGGFPEEIIRAMARREYVLSVRYENGVPILYEGYPKDPGDELLTDSGAEGEQDTIDVLARGGGNDVLTLDAVTAKKLLLSKGTASSKDELLHLMGLDRTGVQVSGRSEKITKDWTRGLDNAKTQIDKLLDEIRDIRVQGDWDERKRARSTMITKFEQIKNLFRTWGEGITYYWMGPRGLPMTDEGEFNEAEINAQQEAIRIAQQKDKK